MRRFLFSAMMAVATAVSASAQPAEGTKLGVKPGFEFDIEATMTALETSEAEAEKDVLHFNTEYTFNHRILLGLRAKGGTVRTDERSAQGGSLALFAKAMLYRESWAGGLAEFSASVETDAVATKFGFETKDELLAEELELGHAGATHVALAYTRSNGAVTNLISAEASKSPKIGRGVFRANYGFSRYLLPYNTSTRQLVAGIETHLEMREALERGADRLPTDTGGWSVALTPTLKLVLTPKVRVNLGATFPITENYGARELREKRSIHAGLKLIF